jgi:hypothetical protein
MREASKDVDMVGEAGIEPTTPGLEGRCSIRLSYSPRRASAATRVASLYCSVPVCRERMANQLHELLFSGCRIGFPVEGNTHLFCNDLFHLFCDVFSDRSCRRAELFGRGFDYLFFCGIENSFQIKAHDVFPQAKCDTSRNVLIPALLRQEKNGETHEFMGFYDRLKVAAGSIKACNAESHAIVADSGESP